MPGSGEILSTEGTTQGDPLTMAMYAIAVTPIIHHLRSFCQTVQQVCYADDDAAGVGSCDGLKMWWDELNRIGPLYGYYPNAPKTCLIVKPPHEHAANEIFAGSGITISTKGNRHLRAALGSRTFVEEFVSKKVATWITDVKQLAKIAHTQPQAAYAAYIHGLSSRWLFLLHTVPDMQDLLQPLED